ncbi:MAG: nucleotidyltransferase domain-containing protein [bacterium]
MREIESKIASIIRHILVLPHYKVFLFGSRADNTADNRSDFDIGIEAQNEIPGEIMVEIRAKVSNLPILQKVDIVDFKKVSKDFKKLALKNIEVLYER